MKYFLQILLMSMISMQVHAQKTVFVRAGQEEGRGILKSRGPECFVITPEHVIASSTNGKVEIRGAKNVLSTGTIEETFKPDLALVRVTGGGEQSCDEWKLDTNYETALENSEEGFLETREPNGTSSSMKVYLTGKSESTISIRPFFQGDKIIKGMSGSSLFATFNQKKVFLGIITDVDTEGKGFVLTALSMDKTLSEFFSNKSSKSAVPSPEPSPVATPSDRIIEEKGFRFELKECKKSGSRLACRLLVTSIEKDASISVISNYYQNSARAYDQNGMEFYPESVTLGNKSHASFIKDYLLVKGIPTPLEFSFKDFSDASTGIPLFRFIFEQRGQQDTEIKFRNIQLSGGAPRFLNPFRKGIQSYQGLGADFQLIECTKSGTNVVCKLLVKTLERDGDLKIIANYYQNSARIYDQLGIEYFPESVQLGTKTDRSAVGDNYILPKTIQTPLTFTFKDVRESALGLSLLRFVVLVKNQQPLEVKFHTIPFTGQASAFLPAAVKGIQSVSLDGLEFQLLECRKNGENIVFKLLVKSIQKDRTAKFVANYYQNSAKIYDQSGKEYLSESVTLGNQTEQGIAGANYILVRDVQVPLSFSFKDVSESSISMFRFIFEVTGVNKKTEVKFSKIPVT